MLSLYQLITKTGLNLSYVTYFIQLWTLSVIINFWMWALHSRLDVSLSSLGWMFIYLLCSFFPCMYILHAAGSVTCSSVEVGHWYPVRCQPAAGATRSHVRLIWQCTWLPPWRAWNAKSILVSSKVNDTIHYSLKQRWRYLSEPTTSNYS